MRLIELSHPIVNGMVTVPNLPAPVIDEYLIMGAFNRDRPTYTWTVYMWETAFTGDWRQGYAAAIGWVGALAMLVVVVGMFYIFRSRD